MNNTLHNCTECVLQWLYFRDNDSDISLHSTNVIQRDLFNIEAAKQD